MRQFLFGFGSNYSLATRFFNKRIQEATITLYSLVRYADELVDNPNLELPGQTHDSLEHFIEEWKRVIDLDCATEDHHPILRANFWLFKTYKIPFQYSLDFMDAMLADTVKERYETYEELEKYMWGSAVVVGLMMSKIIGYEDDRAVEHARSLGEAMQLTNFLRDVHEDYRDRNRIYIPDTWLTHHGVTESILQSEIMTPELIALCAFVEEKCHKLYVHGENGITYLDTNGHLPVLLASRIYKDNLRILKNRNWNLFGKPIRVPTWRKVYLLMDTWFDTAIKKITR